MNSTLFSDTERAAIRNAIERSTSWVTSKQGEDGSIRLREGVVEKDPVCWYKVVWPLALAGKVREANLTASHIRSNFMLENGDFSGGEPRSSEEWFQWRYYTYLNFWVVVGAHKLGRFDLSFPGISYVLRYRDPVTGGFCNEKPYPEGNYLEDSLAASYNGLACLYLGKLEEAREAGRFLTNLLKLQPEINRTFYTAVNAREGGLIEDFPSDEAINRIVDSSQTQQYYYFVGYPIMLLSKLFLATNEEVFLNAAKQYFDFAKECQDDVYASPPSGKLAWGCAILHRIMGEREVGEAVKKQVRFLLETQEVDGSWSRFPGFKRYMNGELLALPTVMDVTSEFSTWLSEILQESG